MLHFDLDNLIQFGGQLLRDTLIIIAFEWSIKRYEEGEKHLLDMWSDIFVLNKLNI